MSNLVWLSSISFETTKYHFPGAKDKVDLVGLLISISLDDEFAASPPQRATRSISSDFYSRFCSMDELAVTYEFAAAPPQLPHQHNRRMATSDLPSMGSPCPCSHVCPTSGSRSFLPDHLLVPSPRERHIQREDIHAKPSQVMPSQIMVDWCLCWVTRTGGHDRLIKIIRC